MPYGVPRQIEVQGNRGRCPQPHEVSGRTPEQYLRKPSSRRPFQSTPTVTNIKTASVDITFYFSLSKALSALRVLPYVTTRLNITSRVSALAQLAVSKRVPFPSSLHLHTLVLNRIPVRHVRRVVSAVPLTRSLISFVDRRDRHYFIIAKGVSL